MDRQYEAYVTYKLKEVPEELKIRTPLWTDISVVDDFLKFKTYHGLNAPVGEMSIPICILQWWKFRWEPVDE